MGGNKHIKRDSFVFYRSYYEAIKELEQIHQPEIFKALFEYALNGQETKLRGASNAVWIALKPQIDANNKKYLNGINGGKFGYLGGAAKGNQNARKQPQNNPETTPNVNVNENENENDR